MSTYQRVSLDKLTVDNRYQRPLHEHRIGKMVEAWNPRQVGTIEVSKRTNGSFAVFDGQHRLAALRAMGEKTAPCIVHEGLTPKQEAELFVQLQRERRSPTPVERFRAQLFSGDQHAKDIAEALTNAGYKVGVGTNDVRAVAAVERVVHRHGLEILKQTFEVIRDAWFGDTYSLDGSIIGGLAEVLNQYHDRWNEGHTFRLRSQAPIDIKRRAQAKRGTNFGGTASLAVANEIRRAAGLVGRPPKRADDE